VVAHCDFCFRAEYSLVEFEGDIFPQVGAALGSAASTRARAPKEIAKSKKVTEDVLEILKHTGIKTRTRSCAAAHPSMAEAVVERALFRVGQHGIGFGDLFEFFLSLRLVGIAVGVILQRQFAIGALDLLLASGASDSQHFVIVAFSVTGQNGLFLFFLYFFSYTLRRFYR